MALYSVKPLYSASATVTNGSDIVQVTGSVNCSFLQSGAIVSISGSNRLVDAVSGTGFDPVSGNSTIKLRRPWPGTTITGQMLVFMSYEGLSDAVFQLKSLIDAAAGAVEGAFSFKGDYDLAAAAALPPNPTEGAGSELWRISTAATVSGTSYLVGDLIYYDQFQTVWRKLAENLNTRLGTSGNLGNAALKTVTTSPTDATAGRVLQAGDFGLGFSVTLNSVNLNTITANGFYYCLNCTNRPAAENGYLEVISENSSYCKQVYTARGSGIVHQRFIFNGTATTWRLVFNQATILGVVSQSGGVPTGAIIQRGSNANGEFTRFADGRMICTRYWEATMSVSTAAGFSGLFMSANISVNFPSNFIAIPSFLASAHFTNDSQLSSVSYRSTGASSAIFKAVSSESRAGELHRLSFTASGYWF